MSDRDKVSTLVWTGQQYMMSKQIGVDMVTGHAVGRTCMFDTTQSTWDAFVILVIRLFGEEDIY